MLIGIVSDEEHAKSHWHALRNEGYNVELLGGDPTRIPSRVDVVVVRVASSSHGGVDTARAWGRQTGRPTIYEDGLSGIRQQLNQILAAQSTSAGGGGVSLTKDDAYKAILNKAQALVEGRGGRVTVEHLRALLAAEVRDMFCERADEYLPLIPGVVATVTPNLKKPEEKDNSMVTFPIQKTPYPTHEGWTKKASIDRLRTAYLDAIRIRSGFQPGTLRAVRESLAAAMRQYTEDGTFLSFEDLAAIPKEGDILFSTFQKKPLAFLMFCLLLLPEHVTLTRCVLVDAYAKFTDTTVDSSIVNAALWYMGREAQAGRSVIGKKASPSQPEPLSPQQQPVVETAPTLPTPEKRPDAEVAGLQQMVDDNSREVIHLMEQVDSLNNRIQQLEGALAQIGTLQVQLSDLQKGVDQQKGQFAELASRLREDIVSSFEEAKADMGVKADPPPSTGDVGLVAAVQTIAGHLFKGELTYRIGSAEIKITF